MRKIITIIFILMLTSFLFSQTPRNHIEGELLIGVTDGIFNFPLEYYASKVSFLKHENKIQIDSLVGITLKQGLFEIDEEKTISFKQQESIDPNLSNRLNLNLTAGMISEFKEFGVYYIGRNVKVFSPQDTISRVIIDRTGKEKTIKSINHNNNLLIKFNSKFDVFEVADSLKKIEGIRYAQPNELAKEFLSPDDDDYSTWQQPYLGPQTMNFQEGWDIVTGEVWGSDWIKIGFIDTDFTNCDIRTEIE